MRRDADRFLLRPHPKKIGLTTSSQADFFIEPRESARAALLLANPGLRQIGRAHV